MFLRLKVIVKVAKILDVNYTECLNKPIKRKAHLFSSFFESCPPLSLFVFDVKSQKIYFLTASQTLAAG